MIRLAKTDEKAILYERWKQYFAHDDGGSIDDYFHYHYLNEASYVYVEGAEIVCSLSAHIHPMKLWNKDIDIVFISGVLTLPKHRHQGYMRKLMEYVCKQFSAYPLLCLQAYEPRLYTPFGFHMMSYHYETTLSCTTTMPTSKYHEVEVTEMSLLRVFNICMQQYDGYRIRTANSYKSLCITLKSQGYQFYGTGDKQMQGYMQYKVTEEQVLIEELLYTNIDAYFALMQKAMSYQFPIILTLPSSLPNMEAKQQGDLMIKVMNTKLLEQRYKQQIPNEQAFLEMLKQPLYTNEYW